MVTKKSIFLSLALISSALVAEPQSFYEYLNEILIKSAPAKAAPARPARNKVAKAKIQQIKPEDLSVKTLKEIEQKLLFVRLLQEEHPDKTFGDVLDKTSIEALDLVNRGEKFAALSRKFGTQTLFGDVMLTSLLACPLTNAATIAQRQSCIRYLGDNQQIFTEIAQALQEIRAGQELLFTFFDDANKIDATLLQQVYGPWGKSLPAILGFKTVNNINLVAGLFIPVFYYCSLADQFNLISKLQAEQKTTNKEILDALSGLGAIKRAPQTLLDWHNPWAMIRESEPTVAAKAKWLAVGCTRTLINDALISWMYYTRFQNEKMSSAIHANMQNRLIGVSKVVRGLQRINLVLQKQPTLLTHVPELAPITALFSKDTIRGLRILLELLQTHTFEGQPSYFSNGIRILRAYNLMCEHKQEFVPALEAVGLLDNYAAAAHLVAHGPAGAYCYATLANDQLPAVNLHKFWNPLITFEQAIVNDVTLGAQGDANMMLTGPNGSGKSTNMKAIILNVLLAQTFGIVAAEQASITPFDKIYTYINVQENIQEGMSTFMAEAQRLEEIDRAIGSTKTAQRCLTVIDEGMRGTVASEGVARLCAVCQHICRIPQSICVLATHFEEPVTLQQQTNGLWTNYYVEIAEPTPGNFVRLYTLKRGTNNWWFTDEAKRKRFIDWLVKAK